LVGSLGSRYSSGFTHTDDTVDGTNCRQHMRRIRPLSSPSFDESPLFETGEHGLEQQVLHLALNKPGARTPRGQKNQNLSPLTQGLVPISNRDEHARHGPLGDRTILGRIA
jgi:hypothetical protein